MASVAVKVGDNVEKDQVLIYLEDEESDELKAAREELEKATHLRQKCYKISHYLKL